MVKQNKPAQHKHSSTRSVSQVEVSGTIRIIDKDGKLKAELPVTSVETQEEKANAIKRHGS